jgi:hypothetical protein
VSGSASSLPSTGRKLAMTRMIRSHCARSRLARASADWSLIHSGLPGFDGAGSDSAQGLDHCVIDNVATLTATANCLRLQYAHRWHGGRFMWRTSLIRLGLGCSPRTSLCQPVARLLGGTIAIRVKPYGPILFGEPGRLRRKERRRQAQSPQIRGSPGEPSRLHCWSQFPLNHCRKLCSSSRNELWTVQGETTRSRF